MLSVENRLKHLGRHPRTMNGITKRLIMSSIMQIMARIRTQGADKHSIHEISLLLRSLEKRRMPGISIFPEVYVMSVFKKEGVYKANLNPHLEVELIGPHIGDIVFSTMSILLEKSYGLKIQIPGKYRWDILRGDEVIGCLKYDRKDHHEVPRLRAIFKQRNIVFCYKPMGLVVETQIHFNPPHRREMVRAEVLPTLHEKEKEFLHLLTAKPDDFFMHIETTLASIDKISVR